MKAKITTLKDVAQLATVSINTASTVLNATRSNTKVSEETRQRVLEAAKTLDYRPNQSARALVTGRTKRIALQVYRIDAAYAARIAGVLQQMIAKQGYDIVLRGYGADDLALQSAVDGILALDSAHHPNRMPPEYQPSIPYVGIGAYYSKSLDFVGIDIAEGAKQAMAHLVATGRTHIIHFTAPSPNHEKSVRRMAYSAAMHAAGLRESFITAPIDTIEQGYAMLPDYIRQHGCPEAIFCRNDDLAIGCYRALHDLGYRIPEDVVIVGCDGVEIGRYLHPTLSTIEWPLEKMCETAWDFLQKRIANPQLSQQHILLQATLTVRGSSKII
jgi:LacI family transcriptional regulator